MTTASARDDRPGPLLRWGLPRDPAASSNLAGFLVSTVATVLLVRAFLAAAGYPQIGGDGLHIAHVLWGGLLMAIAFVVLLSFAGPVVRPVGSLLGGIGFGLFVDEVGKFVTSDNDYFYEPTAALIYLVVVALVLLGEVLHGRRPHHPREYVAGAADHAVAGLVGGFTYRARAEARELLDRAEGARGSAEVGALIDAVEDDPDELVNPIDAVGGFVVRLTHRVVSARWVPWLTIAVLTLTGAVTVGRGVWAWWNGADVPWWIVAGLVASGAVSLAFAVRGLLLVGRDRWTGYLAFRRAVLVSLLVTQVFAFRIDEWAATAGLLVDLAVLGLIAAELHEINTERADPDPDPDPGPESGSDDARRAADAGAVGEPTREVR
ncbi:hypothetical protein [Cellulomonas sp. ATA003]|uniref:hypothetical protein n=1 Tax=Cellulomonas sp. ATA003 TaxID=3073064 RepID=UPI0028737093|nr:hypothetical protein [Cellulomonas sp. ATA003]WNB87056.1 hypothetical protein REH70_07995 [Cellulomonas sp. ATA003]